MSAIALAGAAAALGGGAAMATARRAARCEARAEARFPADGAIVEVAGRRVHARISGHGPDLVMLHGAGGNAREFSLGAAAALARRFRVIAFDRPGLGHSETLHDDGESPREQARALARAAAALGARAPLVLGHSFGGAVALAWALEAPAAVSALVLLGAASQPWPGRLGAWYRWNDSWAGRRVFIPALAAYAPPGRITASVSEIFAPGAPPPDYIARAGVALALRRATLRANIRQVTRLKPHLAEMRTAYPGIAVPVEILHGDEDAIVPLAVHSEPLARQVPGAALTRLAGVGHMPHHQAPGAVEAAVARAAARAGLRPG